MAAVSEQGEIEAQALDPLSDPLADQFRQAANTTLREIQSKAQVSYAASRLISASEVATASLDSFPAYQACVNAFDEFEELPVYNPDGSFAKRVSLYALSTTHEGQQITMVKKTSSKKRLSRTSRFPALFVGARFESLESDPILFESNFDAAAFGERLYIVRQVNLETALKILEHARQAARGYAEEAIENIAIANRDEFLEAVGNDIRMVGKLRGLRERLQDPRYKAAMTLENIEEAAKHHPAIVLDWVEQDGQWMLMFHSDPQRRWRLLRVLDDDYVTSIITEFHYETNSKDVLR